MEFRRLSSADLPVRERIAAFMDTYAAVERVDVELDDDVPLQYEIAVRTLPDAVVLDAQCSPGESRRSRVQCRDGKDDLVLSVITGGRVLRTTDDGELDLGPGEAYLGFNDQPSHHRLHDSPGFLDMAIPRAVLAPLVGDLDRASRGKLPQTPELKLLTGYSRMVTRDVQELPPRLASLCSAHLLDLAVAALGPTRDVAEIVKAGGVRAARLAAIKADIGRNLTSPELSIGEVARRHGISPRYVHALFASEGSSFSAYLLEKRLELAHWRLSDRRFAIQSISAIAYDAGFGDLSYFNRTFRRRYGMTPSDVRRLSEERARN
jgi:AraC-type DNA-binding domain-containing proteins